jgi:hypothetical protein
VKLASNLYTNIFHAKNLEMALKHLTYLTLEITGMPKTIVYIDYTLETKKKKKVKLSLYQAMEAHRVVRRRGSHSI